MFNFKNGQPYLGMFKWVESFKLQIEISTNHQPTTHNPQPTTTNPQPTTTNPQQLAFSIANYTLLSKPRASTSFL